MRDTAFVGTASAIPVAGLVALMWRTGGVDLPDLSSLGVVGWLVVVLVVLAGSGLVVGLINGGRL